MCKQEKGEIKEKAEILSRQYLDLQRGENKAYYGVGMK